MDRAGDVLLVGGGRLLLSVNEVLEGAGFVTSTVSASEMEEALMQPRWGPGNCTTW